MFWKLTIGKYRPVTYFLFVIEILFRSKQDIANFYIQFNIFSH